MRRNLLTMLPILVYVREPTRMSRVGQRGVVMETFFEVVCGGQDVTTAYSGDALYFDTQAEADAIADELEAAGYVASVLTFNRWHDALLPGQVCHNYLSWAFAPGLGAS